MSKLPAKDTSDIAREIEEAQLQAALTDAKAQKEVQDIKALNT